MRRSFALAALVLAVPLTVQAASLTVPIDQSRRLPIAGSAANVVVGNTNIADVRAVDSRTLMVVGKKQGVTNVVVLDGLGRTLYDGEITVSAGPGSMVTVFRGSQAEEYSCSPYCQASAGGSAQPTSAPLQASAPVTQAPAVEPAAPAPTK